VFGVGIWYILRLMHRPPEPHEEPLADVIEGPIRTAGITPAAQGAAKDEA
jgi:cytochrome d ubiquinol oxidase subunit I